MAEGSGWSVTAAGGANTPMEAVQTPPKNANGQHIVYGMSVSFSGTPSSPALIQLVLPDVSPNTVLWEDYVATSGVTRWDFVRGLSIPHGQQVALLVAAGGSGVKATANIHGTTR